MDTTNKNIDITAGLKDAVYCHGRFASVIYAFLIVSVYTFAMVKKYDKINSTYYSFSSGVFRCWF